MNSWNFPNIFTRKGNGVQVISGKDAVNTDLKLLLNSELFEMKYDPGYGSNVPLIRFKPDNQLTRDLLVDAIVDAQIFCPNVRFDRNLIVIEKEGPATYRVIVPVIIDNDDYETQLVVYVEAMK